MPITRQDQYVIGETAKYWTPSLELTDKVLSTVADTIKRTKDRTLQARLRRDLDLILERRVILELELALTKRAKA